MPDKYDEYGRLIKKPAKPKKPEWYEADYPKTFAISIVNRYTGEGIKDWWTVDKLKTPKGAMKKAWEEGSAIMFQPAMPHGQWFEGQAWGDLDIVVRPITAKRDAEQYQQTGFRVFSFSNIDQAYDYVSSPPSGPQRFMEKEVGPRSSTTFGEYEPTGSHGPSTIFHLWDDLLG